MGFSRCYLHGQHPCMPFLCSVHTYHITASSWTPEVAHSLPGSHNLQQSICEPTKPYCIVLWFPVYDLCFSPSVSDLVLCFGFVSQLFDIPNSDPLLRSWITDFCLLGFVPKKSANGFYCSHLWWVNTTLCHLRIQQIYKPLSSARVQSFVHIKSK